VSLAFFFSISVSSFETSVSFSSFLASLNLCFRVVISLANFAALSRSLSSALSLRKSADRI